MFGLGSHVCSNAASTFSPTPCNLHIYEKSTSVIQLTGPRMTCLQCHLSQELFHSAISRYLKEPEKKELLLQLLQWMPGQGYFVDSSTRNLILKNAHLFGRQTIAELLSKQHIVSKAMRSNESSKMR